MRYAFMMSWTMTMMAAGLGVLATLLITDNEDTRQWLLFLAGHLAVLGAVLTFYGPCMWELVFRRGSSQSGPVREYSRRHHSTSSSGSGGSSRTTDSSAKRATPGSGSGSGTGSSVNISAAHTSSVALQVVTVSSPHCIASFLLSRFRTTLIEGTRIRHTPLLLGSRTQCILFTGGEEIAVRSHPYRSHAERS
jgi:hypothetical protein